MLGEDERQRLPSYSNFELLIRPGKRRTYPVEIRSPAGDLQTSMEFPFTPQALENRLLALENVLLRSASTRRLATAPKERTVQEFGEALFNSLIAGDGRSLYDQSRRSAEQAGAGLRLKMRIEPPELASIPWEVLYDSRQAEYVGLSTATPIVRDLGLPHPIEPLRISPPLRILGIVASPAGLAPLDVEQERRRVEEALSELQSAGQVDLRWLGGQTWRELQKEIRREAFHVLHFIGHGGFDPQADEGLIMLANDAGEHRPLRATDLAMLLADEPALRLVVLNSCDGARGGSIDVFSSTASILVRRGIPAVLAMQYEITDRAAIEFARSFYEAVADGAPVDYAVAEGRKAVRLALPGSLEWATPVLYQRATDGVLFEMEPGAAHPATPTASPPPGKVAEESGEASTGGVTDAPITPTRDGVTRAADSRSPSIWTSLRSVWSSIPTIAKGLTGVVTAVAGLITALVAAGIIGGSDRAPEVSPGPIVAEFSDILIEPGVTLGEGCENRGWDCTKYEEDLTPTADQYMTEGIVVGFEVEIEGGEDCFCPVRWTLHDAETGVQVRAGPAWPEALVEPDGPSYTVRGHVWIELPNQDVALFARLHLWERTSDNPDSFDEIKSVETEHFNGVNGLPQP